MFDVTIQQLRVLREVASCGTMAAAAESLGYTPSAISQQIAALERAVGAEVFERIGRRVALTDTGRRLVGHADVLMAGLEQAEADLERSRHEPSGVFTVGVFESLALTVLGPMLTELVGRYPLLEVHSREYLPEDFAAEVQRGALDAAFVVDYPHDRIPHPAGIDDVLLLTERFSLVAPKGHPLAPGPVALTDLVDVPMIAPPSSVGCGRCIEAACHAAGFRPNVRHEIDDYPSSMQLVAYGLGVALMPGLALVEVIPGVEVVELADPLEREVRIIHRRSSRGRPALDAFLAVAAEVADRFDQPDRLRVVG